MTTPHKQDNMRRKSYVQAILSVINTYSVFSEVSGWCNGQAHSGVYFPEALGGRVRGP